MSFFIMSIARTNASCLTKTGDSSDDDDINIDADGREGACLHAETGDAIVKALMPTPLHINAAATTVKLTATCLMSGMVDDVWLVFCCCVGSLGRAAHTTQKH